MTEAWIIDACRTPRGVGKAGKGALWEVHPQQLGATVLKAIAERNGIDTKEVGDVTATSGQRLGNLFLRVAKAVHQLAVALGLAFGQAATAAAGGHRAQSTIKSGSRKNERRGGGGGDSDGVGNKHESNKSGSERNGGFCNGGGDGDGVDNGNHDDSGLPHKVRRKVRLLRG